MSDGLATAALIFLVPLVLIAAGAWFWINRPQHNEHDPTPRVQPLFGSDLVASTASDVDYEDDDFADDADDEDAADGDPAERSAGQTQMPAASAAHTFAPRPTSPSSPSAPATHAPATHAPAAHAPVTRDTPIRTPVIREPMPREPMPREPVARRAPPAPPQRDLHVPAPRASSASSNASSNASARAGSAQQAWADGQAVRFSVPIDGTLQFLPGRLEIVAGQEPGREIRFVRLPDAVDPEITFGRNEGPMYRHVQLRDATVSRMHARLLYRDGAWTLVNLSTTNPVLHNTRALGPEESQLLADGDRIDMGEVVFRYKAR